jgi:hypothetical protein
MDSVPTQTSLVCTDYFYAPYLLDQKKVRNWNSFRDFQFDFFLPREHGTLTRNIDIVPSYWK